MENTAATPPKPKLYGPVSSVLLTVLIFFGIQLVVGIALAAIAAGLKGGPQHATDLLDSKNPWIQLSFIGAVDVLSLGAVAYFLRQRKASFDSIGLNKPALKHVVYMLSGFAVYFVLYILSIIFISKFIPGLKLDQKQELGFNGAAHGRELIPIFISLVLLPPVVEEIVVRGFLFSGLRSKWSLPVSAIITSALFAAAHLGEGGSGGLLWVAGIDTFILSMVLCYMRDKTGSLWPGIGIHMIKNGLAFILLFNIVQYIR